MPLAGDIVTEQTNKEESGAHIVDERNVPFFWIHSAFIDGIRMHRLPPHAVAVYCVLAKHVAWISPQAHADQERDCFLKHATIAKILGVSRRQVMRGMALLEDAKLIGVRRRLIPNKLSGTFRGGKRQTSNAYALLPINSAVQSCHTGKTQETRSFRCDKPGVTNSTQHEQETQVTRNTTKPRQPRANGLGGAADSETSKRLLAQLARHGVRATGRTRELVKSIECHANAEVAIDRLAAEIKSAPNVQNFAGLLLETLSNHDWSIPTASTVAPMKSAVMHYEQ